jgi:hypothetical protein
MLKIKKSSEVPWTNVFHKATLYTIYEEGDRYILVPKEKHIGGLMTVFAEAVKLSSMVHVDGYSGYRIVNRGGDAAGQEVDWPYIELIRIRNHE